jgi:predicted metal-dependent enzyme (double-stranded beta helix superfamily)
MQEPRLHSGGAAATALPLTSTGSSFVSSTSAVLNTLTNALSEAVSLASTQQVVAAVKYALTQSLQSGLGSALPPSFFVPCAGASYARRRLFNDDAARFSIVCMCWFANQRTPIHEHGGSWCVEGVVQGRVGFTRYAVAATDDPRRFSLTATAGRVVEAGYVEVEEATDYHMLFNASEETSVTLHVYGGELTEATVMVPVGESADDAPFDALAEKRALAYTS